MKQVIWIYALCYNESHFVGNFLTAYKDVDKIIVYDNHSTDNSVNLLQQDSRVEIRYYDSGNQIRDDIYLQIKNNCWKEARGEADWVIVIDFDEIFIRIINNKDHPLFDIDLVKPYNDGFTIIRPYGFNMISWDAPLYTKDHPYTYSSMGTYHPPENKLCCFRPDKINEINYDIGCHISNPIGDINILHSKDYMLLHFKAWNYELYMERAKLYYERLSEVNKKNKWGFQYLNTMEEHHNMYLAGMRLRKNILDIDI